MVLQSAAGVGGDSSQGRTYRRGQRRRVGREGIGSGDWDWVVGQRGGT